MRRHVLFASITVALTAAVACERVPENYPELSRFDGTRPELARIANTDGGGGGGGGGINPDTFCNGAPIASQGQECSTSFATQIYPLLTAKNPGGCTDGSTCHGGTEVTFGGPLGVSPTDTWSRLAAFKFRTRDGEPLAYVDICSTDPAQSAITCNIDFAAACGSKMPKERPELSTATKQLIEAWLKCGAPNN